MAALAFGVRGLRECYPWTPIVVTVTNTTMTLANRAKRTLMTDIFLLPIWTLGMV